MKLTPFRSRGLCIAAAFSLVGVLLPSEASACGGFFCSQSPVDQTAEHIVFSVNDDHTVTAVVQIKYAGDKDDFAWIIPAPGKPTLSADFPDAAVRALDVATQPNYFVQGCNFPATAGSGGSTSAGGAPSGSQDAGVTVIAKQTVGPYDTVTLEGTSATVLVDWLQQNGYRITDKMTPLIQPYVEAGMHFVAMRLTADKTVTDIQPLVMTYDSDKPMIPIRLTSVAAQPEMGIVTFILSTRRWAPENYIDLKIPDSLVTAAPYGNQSDYLKVVSVESDKVGGQAFVTEYAKATADLVTQVQNSPINPSLPDAQKAQQALLDALQKHPYITRLYARMSAEEMTEDPVFMVSSNTANVDNVHDLTPPNFDFTKCSYTPNPDPCIPQYCGRSGVCVGVDLPYPGGGGSQTLPACVCANDATARVTTTGANGTPAMYCEPVKLNLDAASDGGVLVEPACEGFDCGVHGACVPMNGNPTCQCEAGYGAAVQTVYDQATNASRTVVSCEVAKGPIPAMPVLPPVGQTKIPDPPKGGAGAKGSGGSTSGTGNAPGAGAATAPSGGGGTGATAAPQGRPSSSNCAMSTGRARDGSVATVLGLAVALAFRGRRRRR